MATAPNQTGYALTDAVRGQAEVHDDEHGHYVGTAIRLNGLGLSSRCRGKWGVYHDDFDRWATLDDLAPGNTSFVLFAEQVSAGDFRLIFKTRAAAAMFALLTFKEHTMTINQNTAQEIAYRATNGAGETFRIAVDRAIYEVLGEFLDGNQIMFPDLADYLSGYVTDHLADLDLTEWLWDDKDASTTEKEN